MLYKRRLLAQTVYEEWVVGLRLHSKRINMHHLSNTVMIYGNGLNFTRYPMFDEEMGQLFPFRTAAMLTSMVMLLVVSALFRYKQDDALFVLYVLATGWAQYR